MNASRHPQSDLDARRSNRADATAFTLIELLVVLTLLVVLAVAWYPALAVTRTRPNVEAFQCLNNNRQLCVAWRMYAEDNRDRMVYSSDDGIGAANPLNAAAWTQSHQDYSPSNPGNWDTNVDIVKGPLWPYTGGNAAIYKCPSDHSGVIVNGERRPRVRSMAMNLYLGGYAGTSGGWPSVEPYCLYTNLNQIGGGLPTPGPAKLWVFLDMREDCISWGNFFTDMTGYSPSIPSLFRFTSDLPGYYHHGAVSISFADSHCELHRWQDRRTIPPISPFSIVDGFASPRNEDIAWLQDHSTRPK